MGQHLLIFLLIVVSALYSKADDYAPTFRGIRSASSDSEFVLNQLAADSVGNTYWAGGVGGSTGSVGSLTVTNSGPWGKSKGCLFKLGPDLDERWAKIGSGSGNQWITGLAVDADRNCYFAFTVWENSLVFDNVAYNSPSNQFTVVFKYTRGGNRIWSHQADGVAANSWGKALAVNSDNEVFFGGTLANNHSYLRKLDTNGTPLWTRTGDQIQTVYSYSLQTDAAGSCFMLSSFTNATVTFGNTILRNRGTQSYVLVKYDPAGNVSWARRGGGSGPGQDWGIDLAVDHAGDAYVLSVIGSTNFLFGTNDIPLTSSDWTIKQHWVLAKYGADSQPVWARPFPVPYITVIGGVSLVDNGVLISVSGSHGDFYSSSFLAKCSPDGELVWKKHVRTRAEGATSATGSISWSTRLLVADNNSAYVAILPMQVPAYGYLGFDSISINPPPLTHFIAKLSFDPQLSTSRNGDWLTLSWPTNEAGFFLESSEHLDGTNGWSAVTNSVVLQNGQHAVTNLISGTNAFYRLRKTLP